MQDAVTPLNARWIKRSRFVVLSTVGPEGTDGSPRGDVGPVVEIYDPKTLLLPDWRGNNRMDGLRNVVRDARVSLMFMVQGSGNVVRVNGTAEVNTAPDLIGRFARAEGLPRSVIVITVREVYSQCARAVIRADLWSSEDQSEGLPSVGDLLREAKDGFDGQGYDDDWAARAARTMW